MRFGDKISSIRLRVHITALQSPIQVQKERKLHKAAELCGCFSTSISFVQYFSVNSTLRQSRQMEQMVYNFLKVVNVVLESNQLCITWMPSAFCNRIRMWPTRQPPKFRTDFCPSSSQRIQPRASSFNLHRLNRTCVSSQSRLHPVTVQSI